MYDIVKITAPVAEDMEQMRMNLRDIIGRKNPLLLAAADQIFGAGGKRLRPVLVFLVARATKELMNMSDITDRQRRLAEITEMIHTASLVHDDVLDDCDTRRGKETIHTLYGTRVAILAGDFLFAQSSWFLANLDNLEVIKLISQVIADFADGEISQAGALFYCDLTLEEYLEKSHNKTASLIAASCKSAAVFSECTESVKVDMYEYGKHLGLAFQVVDDILDFTQSEEQLGKPQGQDLASGHQTAPTMFALTTVNGELTGASAHVWTLSAVVVVALSCVAGMIMSWASMNLRGLVSATTFTVTGTMCKIATVVVNCLMWDKHASMQGLAALFVCLVAGMGYQQAPLRADIAAQRAKEHALK